MDISKSYCYNKMNYFNQKVWEVVDSSCKKSFMGRFLGTPAVILTNIVYTTSIFADIGEVFLKFHVNLFTCNKKEEDNLLGSLFNMGAAITDSALIPLHSLATGLIAPAGTLIRGSKVAEGQANFYRAVKNQRYASLVAEKCYDFVK